VELLAILRVLWRRRVLVALGAVAAIAVGLMVAGGVVTRAGVAFTRVVLDTPDSQLIHPSPKGADTLEWRAALLANLLSSRPMKQEIARDLGIPADRLLVIEPLLSTPTVPTPLAAAALDAAKTTGDYVVTVRYEPGLPIISIETRAPDPDRATRLVEATVRALTSASKPAPISRQMQELVVASLGRPQSREVVSGGGPGLAVAISVALFAFWCVGLVLSAGMARAWGAAGRVQAA
jgi:hypothetical protein